jgi:dihydrofolate reductase
MVLSLIAAVAEGSVIGWRDRIPWNLPADRAHFRKTTWGHPVLMGRKTFVSIGGPLPGRETVVLSRDAAFRAPGCTVASDLHAALAPFVESGGEVFVAGGAQVYAAALHRADRLYITRVAGLFQGDAFFPEVDWGGFARLRFEPLEGDPPSEFVLYERVH